ncbi:hypothetical protein GGX14DRAFT_388733 [Mycena pura]|uniref:Uncharacterized protein n=1 Tax=Mycena pura TaxID=153505 RepID=A0AAD6YJB7_9AGAR|nr:hypothetical protein GGX14DRAFT_388733 [Mycena pura]
MPLWTPSKSPSWIPPKLNDGRKRLYLRAGTLGPEGFGSALQHFKQSIVLSRMLDSSLILASNEGRDHGYSTSRIYNGDMDASNFMLDSRKICRIEDYVSQPVRKRLVRGLCEGNADALDAISKIKADMESCTSIVDSSVGETTENLNGCVAGWVRERLAPPSHTLPIPLTFPPNRPVTVGIHIRWGDTAVPDVGIDHDFRGSMAIRDIIRILRDIRAQMGERGVKLTIAMEHADPAVLTLLEEKDYTLVDSGNDVAVFQTLSNNDILLLGESSYGVLVHLVAPPGLTIVDKNYRCVGTIVSKRPIKATFFSKKYTNTTGFGRDVVFLKDYNPDIFRLTWSGSSPITTP